MTAADIGASKAYVVGAGGAATSNGNATTLDAAGATGLILTGGGTDPFHPTAIKASLGALWTVPWALAPDLTELLADSLVTDFTRRLSMARAGMARAPAGRTALRGVWATGSYQVTFVRLACRWWVTISLPLHRVMRSHSAESQITLSASRLLASSRRRHESSRCSNRATSMSPCYGDPKPVG